MEVMQIHWNEDIEAWNLSGVGVEYVAWNGSKEIIVYNKSESALPIKFIEGDRPIKSVEDFRHVLDNGQHLIIEFKYVRR